MTPAYAAPRLANTAGWVQTPFERDPFLFHSEQDAIRALGSPDLLMRRSGVQWLGRWTGTYTTYGIAPNEAACAAFRTHAGQVVPALTRALREMPDGDSLQAARLLALLGDAAKPALPTLCAELSSLDYGDGKPAGGDDFVARADLLNSLCHVCGGPDEIAPTLAALMKDSDAETRRAAAAAVRFSGDPTFRHLSPPPEGAYHWFSAEQDTKWHTAYYRQTFPALALCVADPIKAVCLAALTSLESVTYDSADAPWQKTLPPLARAAVSKDPAVRLAALRVLTYTPADISSLAPSLRFGLHGTQEERNYVLAALSHAARTDRSAAQNAFLPDLASSDLAKRRQAADDVRQAAIPLFAGGFWPGPYPLDNWWNDSRLFADSAPAGLTEAQQEAERKRKQAAAEIAQTALLAALVKSAADPDHAVRASAAASLEQIGNWTWGLLGSGSLYNPGRDARPLVEKALAQALVPLQTLEPALAKLLQDLQDKIVRGPSAVF